GVAVLLFLATSAHGVCEIVVSNQALMWDTREEQSTQLGQLLLALKNTKDPGAFSQLSEILVDEITPNFQAYFLWRGVRQEANLEELIQETFLRIFVKLPTFLPTS